MTEPPTAPGTYALLLRLRQPARLRVGALGTFRFPAGWYVYVGSARGPGGLAARVGRHVRGAGARHWHIDYLREVAAIEDVWWREGDERQECAWAREIGAWPQAEIIAPRFGASDCKCPAHLYYFRSLESKPRLKACKSSTARLTGEKAIL